MLVLRLHGGCERFVGCVSLASTRWLCKVRWVCKSCVYTDVV